MEDGKQQDREEEVRPRTRHAELDPKPAIQGILGIDLENDCGRMLRSAALMGVKVRAPRTAAVAATQRRAGANRTWCREGTAWRTIWTERGGRQGGSSGAADNTKAMTSSRITRVGLQDDMYAVAGLEDVTSLLEELKIELQACGHRLRVHKCKVWFPGRENTSDDDLPHEARVLLQRIPREIGGLELLGAAAQGDWCAAIGQAPGSGRVRLTTHVSKRLGRVQALIPRIRALPLQRDYGKGRHKAWMMLT